VYRWDYAHFDIDFENICLLSNKHIKTNLFDELDHTFYKNIVNMKYRAQTQKEEKRKMFVGKANDKKKARLAIMTIILD
jgi:hypothetical protein